MHFLAALDHQLFLALNGLHAPAADLFFFRLSWFGQFGIIFPLVLSMVILFSRKLRYPRAILLAVSVGAVDLATRYLKIFFARPRPFDFFEAGQVHTVGALPGGFSFPSGHTSLAFVLATALFLLFGRRLAWVFAVAFLIGYSRIYLGVHYPADVAAGALLGAAGAWLPVLAVKRFTPYLSAR